MSRRGIVVAGLLAAGLLSGAAQPAAAQFQIDLKVQEEVAAAVSALDLAHQGIGGMGGIGIIPEPDLSTIHDILSAGEVILRDARRRAQQAATPQEEIWAVSQARAARAIFEAVDEYRSRRGYQ